MKMIHDSAYDAYEATRRHDEDAALAALSDLLDQGPAAVETAMRLWIDRTIIVMRAAGQDLTEGAALSLEMESDSLGEASPIDHLPPEISWAGRMFAAHAVNDQAMWQALWSVVPTTADHVTDHVMTLLTTMVSTATAYAEDCPTGKTCCYAHYYGADVVAARIAVAHLN